MNKWIGMVLAIVIFVACVWQINAGVTTLISPVTLKADTSVVSSLKYIVQDSSYRWVFTVRGYADVTLKLITKHIGIEGDTVVLDSTVSTMGFSKYIGPINGDSLMNAWYPRIDSNETARKYEKKQAQAWQYKVIIQTKDTTANTGKASVVAVTN